MTASPPLEKPAPLRIGLPLAILASAGIAYLIPFDAGFDRLTMGSPALRFVAMIGVWTAGLWLQRRNGFILPVHGLRWPVSTIILICAGVAAWCAAMDAVVFKAVVPASYVAFENQPLALRLFYYCTRAFNENALHRLFLGGLFAWLLRLALPQRKLAFPLALLGMSAAHLVNVVLNAGPMVDLTPVTAAWMFCRFFLPGAFWGWLYVRHGFVANETAAIGVHLVLQPMMSAAF
ncbi:hypothetical protein [Phenylobacterium sp.]|uniref:hypothetical protein n=1 Tax=Phenylobacterium sp. TaxID=1871053 RepID=UPI002F4009DD